MAGKRKRDVTLTPTLGVASGAADDPQPQRKRTKQNIPAVNRDYTIAEIVAFEDGICKIKDWTCNNVIRKHIQVIYWFDVENLSREECAKRYPNKEGKPCSVTNIFKVYNTYAPRFYAEKGLDYIPLGKRGPARAAPIIKRKKGEQVKKVKRNPLDVRLEKLFNNLPVSISLLLRSDFKGDVSSSLCPHHSTSNSTGDLHATDQGTVTFLCKAGSTMYGDPSGPQIPRVYLLRHCTTIRESLLENPHINTITHGPEINADTICRFSACITGLLEPRLPEFVTTAYGTFEQEWSMAELEDLYILAMTLGAAGVCDLVIDRFVEELRRPQPRIVNDEFGEARCFDTLDIGPELLDFLWLNDNKGFAFFVNVLFSQRLEAFERMKQTHLANWHKGVKRFLIKVMESGDVIDLFSASPSTICKVFHHHSPEDLESRLPESRPPSKTRKIAASKTSARPTLNARPRYDNFEKDTPNTLHLIIPRFPYTHNKHPRTSPAELDPIYALAEHGTDRLREHRNGHLDKRIQYANEKFNAHHDTEDVCREKLRMCREKVTLFEAQGIEVSDEEVEKVVSEHQRVSEQGEGDSQDEDEDEEMRESEEELEDVQEDDFVGERWMEGVRKAMI